MKLLCTFLLAIMYATFNYNNLHGQCLNITCPVNIIVNNDSGVCGAVCSFSPPSVTATCTTGTQTFNYSGSIVYWTVPASVTSIHIEARGAQGGNHTNSSVTAGYGATMSGDFAVTGGQQLKILVGQQPSTSAGSGGGGGTFVTDVADNPLIVAGGGGGSGSALNSASKHGQTTTTAGNGTGGSSTGGAGGAAGNGGSVGSSSATQAGAGGGLLTNGANGWITNTRGIAFVNGGNGGSANSPNNGGFGGGGSGTGFSAGGGGGGYSGGGSGAYYNGFGGIGGGGGSFNGGANQVNTSGSNTGNGIVIITYTASPVVMITQTAGLASGSMFPVGNTIQTFTADDGLGNSATCSFAVTVVDNESPTISCPSNVATCTAVVNGLSPTSVTDNCSIATVTYVLSGATTGSGNTDASGTVFNPGLTTVQYTAIDVHNNTSTCSFTVDSDPAQPPALNPFTQGTMCLSDAQTPLPNATPAGGVFSGPGVTGNVFDPALSGVGNFWVVYTVTNSSGCSSSDSSNIIVSPCVGITETNSSTILIYPNPNDGNLLVDVGLLSDNISIRIAELNGRFVKEAEFTRTQFIGLDISDIASGIYILQLNIDGQLTSVKLIRN